MPDWRADALKTVAEKRNEEDAEILRLTARTQKKLTSALELAKGITYTEPLTSTWQAPSHIRRRTTAEHQRLRDKHHILLDLPQGEDLDALPPPIASFKDMKLLPPILKYLKERKITKPSPIQLQGIPIAFAGRDLIGVAFTGSGKTLSFSLPILMHALEEEKKLPFTRGEGPVAMIVCPSRELARQTYEQLVALSDACRDAGYPTARVVLAIGGINMQDQSHVMSNGFHIIVATPGRLQDMLEKRKFTCDSCRCVGLEGGGSGLTQALPQVPVLGRSGPNDRHGLRGRCA
jgi:ATP-dependent RNA helicase DDX41